MTDPSVPAVVMMTAIEARAETDKAKKEVVRGFTRLAAIRDREGWRSLDYPTWSAYLDVEWGLTRNYANKLIDHTKFVAELEVAAGTAVPGLTENSTRVARSQRRSEATENAATAAVTLPPEEVPDAVREDVTQPQGAGTPVPTPDEVPAGGLVVRDLRLPTVLNRRAEERADDAGMTVNEYVVALIEADLDPIPTAKANGQQRTRMRAPALEAAITKQAGSVATKTKADHVHKAESRGASGVAKCKCGASKVGDKWVEP